MKDRQPHRAVTVERAAKGWIIHDGENLPTICYRWDILVAALKELLFISDE